MQKNNKIYFIGIGGIGMSALAQLFVYRHVEVSGSDRSASRITDLLKEREITIHIGHSEDNVPTDADLVVYSDAIPEDNVERVRAEALGIPQQSYFMALGEATRDLTNVVISGTHGKTTTTGMIAKILIDAGLSPTVIAGSILSDYGSNFVPGTSTLCVIEGCEYRRHFLKLSPTVLVINNIELDHTDYFKDEADVIEAFHSAAHSVPETGTIVTTPKHPNVTLALAGVAAPVVDYTDVKVPELILPGAHNYHNAQAAKTVAQVLGVAEEKIDASLSAFKGTWRRFEIKGHTKNGALVIDDYAHHPSALQVTLQAAREKYPDKKITIVFHPHLYSRTKSFFNEFAHELAKADEVFLLPIYAAREEPDPEITSEKLVEKINILGTPAKFVTDFESAELELSQRGDGEVVFTVGAGDVYKLADILTK